MGKTIFAPRVVGVARSSVCLLLFANCFGSSNYKRSYATPASEQIVAELARRTKLVGSFSAESTMEFWLGKERLKTEVWLMGQQGAKIRLNALSPAGGDTMADLACDGANFQFVDRRNNCQLSGVCDESAIAKLLQVRMSPDDFVLLSMGQTPVIAAVSSTSEWDSDRGAEKLILQGDGGIEQTIWLDGRNGTSWDVLKSEVKDGTGKSVWTLEHKNFKLMTGANGQTLRVPERSRYQQASNGTDVKMDWTERVLNPELGPDKFQMPPPPDGLPRCGQK